MCLIAWNWKPGAPTPLLLIANRDEFYTRPTKALSQWADGRIVAGKDLDAGGTWLGLSVCAATGRPRLAALTNYRDVAMQKMDAESRGHITASFLNNAVSARDYLATLVAQVGAYNPFNLILFDGQDLMGFESRHARAFTLPPGITSVSNADFNTPWPKLVRLRTCFEQTLATTDEDALLQDQFFELLSDSRMASDADLPQTGIPRERERILSATFITSPDYGTRASSVICIRQQTAEFVERRFDAHGFTGEIKQTLSWSKPCLPS